MHSSFHTNSRANGSKFTCMPFKETVPIWSVVILGYSSVDSAGIPSDPEWIRKRLDVSPEHVIREAIPYSITVGKLKGTVHSCRGCKKYFSLVSNLSRMFHDRLEPRIQVSTEYNSSGCWPRIVDIQFCLSMACLTKGIESFKEAVRKCVRSNYY